MLQRNVLGFISERRLREMAYLKNNREAELCKLSDLCELNMNDRYELDNAVLQLLGVTRQGERRELLQELSLWLRDFFEYTRQKEEKAIANKNKTRRRLGAPEEIAAQVLADIRDRFGCLLRQYREFVDLDRPFDTVDLPAQGIAQAHDDLFTAQGGVRFVQGRRQIALTPTRNPEQAALITLVAAHGVRGLVRIPLAADECARLHSRYQAFLDDRAGRVRQLVEERTGDAGLQERVIEMVLDSMARGK